MWGQCNACGLALKGGEKSIHMSARVSLYICANVGNLWEKRGKRKVGQGSAELSKVIILH